MIDAPTITTIVLMATSTYATRVLGYMVLRNRNLGPSMSAVLENVPGCVLISVIAPAFVSDNPANLLGLAITLLAATCLPLLPTVIIGIISTGFFRHFLGQ